MFALVFIAIVCAVIALRLARVVGNDRPMTTPRSHTHELDRYSRVFRAL
jgi:hypothetical protein